MNITRGTTSTADERSAFDGAAEGMPMEPEMAPLEVDAADWLESTDEVNDLGGDEERPHHDDAT